MRELTEVEDVAIESWKKSSEYTTFEIAAKVLVSRHYDEYQEIRKAVSR